MKKLIICLMTAVMLFSHSVLFSNSPDPSQNYAAENKSSQSETNTVAEQLRLSRE
jgi:hypothetical protein